MGLADRLRVLPPPPPPLPNASRRAVVAALTSANQGSGTLPRSGPLPCSSRPRPPTWPPPLAASTTSRRSLYLQNWQRLNPAMLSQGLLSPSSSSPRPFPAAATAAAVDEPAPPFRRALAGVSLHGPAAAAAALFLPRGVEACRLGGFFASGPEPESSLKLSSSLSPARPRGVYGAGWVGHERNIYTVFSLSRPRIP